MHMHVSISLDDTIMMSSCMLGILRADSVLTYLLNELLLDLASIKERSKCKERLVGVCIIVTTSP